MIKVGWNQDDVAVLQLISLSFVASAGYKPFAGRPNSSRPFDCALGSLIIFGDWTQITLLRQPIVSLRHCFRQYNCPLEPGNNIK
jgi:hypothetical protein